MPLLRKNRYYALILYKSSRGFLTRQLTSLLFFSCFFFFWAFGGNFFLLFNYLRLLFFLAFHSHSCRFFFNGRGYRENNCLWGMQNLNVGRKSYILYMYGIADL